LNRLHRIAARKSKPRTSLGRTRRGNPPSRRKFLLHHDFKPAAADSDGPLRRPAASSLCSAELRLA